MFKRLRSFFRVLTRRREFEDGMTDELRFHIEQYTDELLRTGVSPEKAARLAQRELGSLTNIKGDCREAFGVHLFDEFRRELSYAVRLLRKTPGFTATALLTLAVCFGANLTIFAVIDSVLLRPLPFPEPGRLVTIFNSYPKAGVDRDGSSETNYYERRGHIPAFTSLSIYAYGTEIVGEPGSTDRLQTMRVSPDFFSTLGLGPAIGRTFTDEETTSETDHVAILSDTFWRQRYNADPNVLGKQIRVNSVPRTVIGVLPPTFRFLSSDTRLFLPLASRPEDRAPSQRHSGGNVIQMIARLQPDATLAQAQSQLDAQNATLEVDDPQAKMIADAGFRSLVVPLHADHVAAIRPTLLLLQAGAMALLLIGAVNLENLLLVRASSRVKELAVRQALGASRGYLVSEVIVETTLLTIVGGLLGLAVGAGGIHILRVLGADRLPLGARIAFDARLALVGMAAAILMGIVFAVPIAWFNLRRHLGNALQSESRGGTSGRAAQMMRHGFIVSQIALAFMLLAGAGLLGLSLQRVMAVSPGFQSDHILTGQILLPWADYPDGTARLKFVESLMDRIGHLPGVLSPGVVNNVPFSGNIGKSAATVMGHVRRPGESVRGHYSYGVAGDYFRAMGFSLRAGRFLTADDSRRSQRVCVVDEDFARFYWPNASPIGQRLWDGSEAGKDADAFTVVGVVGGAKQAGLTEDEAQGAIYYPYAFRIGDSVFVAVRTSLPPESLGLALQKEVRQIDPDIPVNDLRSMDTRIADSLAARRSPALLAGLFSGIALLLTAIGTYGVLTYAVAQRRREIGLRMALGAQPRQIRIQFLSLSLRLLIGGTILGVIGAWLTGQATRAVLFHVQPLNPAILAAAACLMGVVSLVACLLPSQRAARISPMEALTEQ
ncbi:MAG TPA: ABC transporter permease [Planctomycetaceae bacterium]|jgi:predicted permease|nr:ABC transporter permease [Planctomycetaceae bacterium]